MAALINPPAWQAEDRVIRDWSDGLKVHVAEALDSPLVVLLEDGADETCDGGLVGEDADHLGAALDLGSAAHIADNLKAVEIALSDAKVTRLEEVSVVPLVSLRLLPRALAGTGSAIGRADAIPVSGPRAARR